MTPKICVSILPETVTEALKLIEKIDAYQPDLIEIRFDRLKNHGKIAEIRKKSKTPLVATNRTIASHGEFAGNESQRQKTLLSAARNGFEYIDIELESPHVQNVVKKLNSMNTQPIISFHDFNGTPALGKLNETLRKAIENDAGVCKIVTTAQRVEDNLAVLNFVSEASKKAKIVCFCMGSLGKPSRLLSPVFGAFFTIASFEHGKETAAGQLTIQEMKTAYQTLGLT